MDRRGFLQQSAGVVAGVAVSSVIPTGFASAASMFTLKN